MFREVVDICKDDTFSFTVPYYSESPWQLTGWHDDDTAVEETSNGYFRINVLNGLVAASTVASNVEVLLYVSGADDFQVTGLVPNRKPVFAPEMAVARVMGPIADATLPPVSIDANALCSGEVFTSVKQLLQLARPVAWKPPTVGDFKAQTVWPYSIGLFSMASSATITNAEFTGDYLSEISCGFAYNRGGIRLFVPQGTLGNSSAYLGYTSGVSQIVESARDRPGPGTTYILSEFTEYLAPMATHTSTGVSQDIIVPHLSPTPFRLSHLRDKASGAIPLTRDTPRYVVTLVAPQATSSYSVDDYFVYRSGADDFSVGYFIGFPGFLDYIEPI